MQLYCGTQQLVIDTERILDELHAAKAALAKAKAALVAKKKQTTVGSRKARRAALARLRAAR